MPPEEADELFFPDKSALLRANDAIMMCFGCRVREECKRYKKETGSKHGIWAGEFSSRDE